MRRKRPLSFVEAKGAKEKRPHLLLIEPTMSPLVQVVQQYGILVSIVSHLDPEDLLSLALTVKAIYDAIAPRGRRSIEALLGRLPCPGRGVRIRRRCHPKSAFSKNYRCTEYVACGSEATNQNINTQPCVGCKITTCDECRIHCVYQTIYGKPCAEDELPNFSGHVLLNASEVPILSPHHLPPDQFLVEPPWQDPSEHGRPYHDQGSIDMPMEATTYGPPEDVDYIINLNLGRTPLPTPSGSSEADLSPSPSPVLEAFYQATEQRKRWFCDQCLPIPGFLGENQARRRETCDCSLKGRYLDRWLCLRCYEREEENLAAFWPAHVNRCYCGTRAGRAICTWCWRLIADSGLGEPAVSELHEQI